MNADTVCAASGWATGQKAINGYREGQAISMAKPASVTVGFVEA
jgi:hypothetical protein